MPRIVPFQLWVSSRAQHMRYLDRPGVAVARCVRPRQQVPVRVRAAVRVVGVPVPFHGGKHGRLLAGDGQAHRIAKPDLQRSDDQQRQDGTLQRPLEHRHVPLLQQIPGRYPGDKAERHFERCDQHVREAVDHIRIEDGPPPILDDEHAVAECDAGRRLHPRVRDQDPQGRQAGRECHVEGCRKDASSG